MQKVRMRELFRGLKKLANCSLRFRGSKDKTPICRMYLWVLYLEVKNDEVKNKQQVPYSF